MSEIGIVTYYGENYGACLQAYALQTAIDRLGYKSEIIRYLPRNKHYKKRKKLRKLRYILNPIQYLHDKKVQLEFSDEKKKRSVKFQYFVENYLCLSRENYSSLEDLVDADLVYKAYVTGSDQLWNPIHHHNNPVYFLDFASEKAKRIAYAPSIAINQIPEKFKKGMCDLVKKMDYLSVREDVSVNILKEFLPDKDIGFVLDPTLLIEEKFWEDIVENVNGKEPYIFCYLFGSIKYIDKFVKYIRKKTGYKVVALPYNTREMSDKTIEKIFDAGPIEFISLIKNARLICTDSFHATAFSIIFRKPFYTLLRQNDSDPENMNSRFYSILNLLKLRTRLITPSDNFPNEVYKEIDYSETEIILKSERQKSMNFLKKALGESICENM